MSTIEADGWRRTSPFAAIFYVGKIWQAIARNAVQSLAPLAAFLVAFEGNLQDKLVFGIGILVIGTAVLAFLRYWFFRYRITENSVLIRDGVFRKTQLDIKFERVQAVNTQQNIVFRLLGLLTVSFDTAGSKGQEGHLPAIRADDARALRDRIRHTAKQDTRDADTEAQAGSGKSPRTLLRLTSGDMVRIGLSSKTVFLFLVLLGPVSEYLEQDFRETIEETAVVEFFSNAQERATSSIRLALLAAAGILVVLFSASIAGAFLRYHRFELVADEDVLRSTGGLITRHEHSVNRRKVQSLTASQHAVLRLFRRFRLRATQASGSRTGRSDFLVPVCTEDNVAELSAEIFPAEFEGLTLDPHAPAFHRISPLYLRSRIGLFGVLPALPAAVLLWSAVGIAGLAALAWIPVWALVSWQQYRRYGLMYGRDGLALRSGFIGYRVVAWLHRKVQRISVTQSPFQRRKQLATVRIHLAAGPPVTIPYIELAAATHLRDVVLYRVESSLLGWH